MQVGTTVTPPNGAAPAAPPGDGGGDGGGDAPDIAKLVSDAATAAVAKAFEGYTTKINGEQAKFRKQLEALTKPAGGTAEPKPAVEPKAVDHEAMMGMVEQIAEIRAGLPAGLREKIKARTEGLAYADKLRVYEAAQEAHAEAQAEAKAATEAGGEKPDSQGAGTPKAKSTARAATSATRDSAPKPKRMSEYVDLARTAEGRKVKAILDADPTFDPSDLPRP